MEAFWPGPMTLILPKADCIPNAVSAGLDTVGIRLPSNADARALIRAAGRPIAAPSANRAAVPARRRRCTCWKIWMGAFR